MEYQPNSEIEYCENCGKILITVETGYYDRGTGKKLYCKICPNWLCRFWNY